MSTVATKPQHATFARSKDDVLSALSFYFGQPVNPEMLRDYNDHHAATYRAHRRVASDRPKRRRPDAC